MPKPKLESDTCDVCRKAPSVMLYLLVPPTSSPYFFFSLDFTDLLIDIHVLSEVNLGNNPAALQR